MKKATEIIELANKISEASEEEELLRHDSLTGLLQYFKQKFKQIDSKIQNADSLVIAARSRLYVKEEILAKSRQEVMRFYGHELTSLIPKSRYRESRNFEKDKDGFSGIDVHCIRSPKTKFLKEITSSNEEIFWVSLFYEERNPDYLEVVTCFSVSFTNYFEFYDIFNFKNEVDDYNSKFSQEELEKTVDELKYYIDVITKAIRFLESA